MNKTLIYGMIAAGLGCALALKYGTRQLPAKYQTGYVAEFGVPIVGAGVGLLALSFVK